MNKNFIKVVQEIANNAWPASYSYLMNGWIVRFNKGVTYRANSVLPLNWWGESRTIGKGNLENLEESVQKVETYYLQSNLSSKFMLHDNHEPDGLEAILVERSYKIVMPTSVMGTEISKLLTTDGLPSYKYKYTKERQPIWFPALEKLSPWRTKEKMTVIGEIMDRITIPRKRYFYAEHKQKIIGVVLAILDGHFLGILNLAIDEKHKRNGVATQLIHKAASWGISHKTKYFYLQVEKTNTPAINLYRKLGFQDWYTYRYYEKEFQKS